MVGKFAVQIVFDIEIGSVLVEAFEIDSIGDAVEKITDVGGQSIIAEDVVLLLLIGLLIDHSDLAVVSVVVDLIEGVDLHVGLRRRDTRANRQVRSIVSSHLLTFGSPIGP